MALTSTYRVFVLVLISASLCLSQTPIPNRPLGFTYISSEQPKVVIEIFYDHLCIDSKPNWPMLKSVLDDYSTLKEDIKAIIHITSLPYHHNAFFAQKAGVLVRSVDPMQFVTYLETIFEFQNNFLSGAVNMTEPEVQASMATLASSKLAISKDVMMTAFTDPKIDMDARYAFKYAGHRGITGTPQFIINGVHDPDAAGYNADQWKSFISSLIKGGSLNKGEL